MLMWYVGGEKSHRPKLKTYVSLTRGGLPPYYRKLIRGGNNPKVVQIVLSVCTLSRMILVPPKGGMRINPSTIHERGFQLGEKCKALCQELADFSFQFLSGYVPAYSQIPLRLGFYFKPMFTSGPNTYKRPSRESKVVREAG